MDILISSNLERLLSDLTGSDTVVRTLMRTLRETGSYCVDTETLRQIQNLFWAGFCDDQQTRTEIHDLYQSENYLCDTHSAVAVQVYQQYVAETGDQDTPAVIASTASPYKFADSVLAAVSGTAPEGDDFEKIAALSALTHTTVPAPIAALRSKQPRFTESCTPEQMPQTVLRIVGAAEC